MIFVDSNIPMYLIGVAHPLKLQARRLLANERLSARDALHVAIMERHSVPRIMSFDSGFDGLPNIKRLS